MRLLLDANVSLRLADDLTRVGHDVTTVVRDYGGHLSDQDILAIAYREGRVLITNDTDFGDLIIRQRLPHAGVILLRVRARDVATKRDRLIAVLQEYADQLTGFLVVTEHSVRVRRTE